LPGGETGGESDQDAAQLGQGASLAQRLVFQLLDRDREGDAEEDEGV
jgi:hypothetical protein